MLKKTQWSLAQGLIIGLICACVAAQGSESWGRGTPAFSYAAGTESLEPGCGGELKLTDTSMTFACPGGSVTIPYHSITLMQYRPAVSRSVRRMKLRWRVKPSGSGGKQNLFFTVLYRNRKGMQALVLRVRPDDMRPYLAEIELSTGKRIRVWDYRGFE